MKAVGDKILPYVQENVDDMLLVEDDELIGAFLDMVENHKMIVENSGLLSVAALRQLDLRGQESRLRAERRKHGCHHHVLHCSARSDPERPHLSQYPCCFRINRASWSRWRKTIADEQGNVIKLEHNQFVSTNRNAAVELRITMEAFGTEHKNRILDALEKERIPSETDQCQVVLRSGV